MNPVVRFLHPRIFLCCLISFGFIAQALAEIAPASLDALLQQAYLKASNPDAGDHFGTAVAISGDLIAVGAPLEGSDARGINGVQTNNAAPLSGAVYVFSRNNGVWTQEAYLKASNAGIRDSFGGALALSGNTLVVGAIYESSNPEATPDPVDNDLLLDSGAAYVFVRNAGVWSQQAILKAGKGTRFSKEFGTSVAIDGDTIVVGAPFERNSETGINPPYPNDYGPLIGAAYVFTRQGSTWNQAAYIKPPYPNEGGLEFGHAVAVAGPNIFVGVPRDASGARGINGSMSQNSTNISGAVFAYRLEPGGLVFDAFIKSSNSDPGDSFGRAIAASGDTLVASAITEDSAAVGINGDQGNSTTKRDSGAVYVFDRSSAGWTQTAYLKAPQTAVNDLFGIALALDGDVLGVGSQSKVSGPEGSLNYLGTAYIYHRANSTWTFQSVVKPSKKSADENFALSMALSDGSLIVGAEEDDSAAVGVNDTATGFRSNSGAAYVFSGVGTPAVSPVIIQVIQINSQMLILEFTATPGLKSWRFQGGSSLPTLADNLTASAAVTEPSPGHYHAEIAISHPQSQSYFVKVTP